MKMKNFRLFLLGFMTVSFVFLTGFEKRDVNNVPLAGKQSLAEIKNAVSSKQKKTKNKPSLPSVNENAELQKSLDLSIPFKDSENAGLKIEQNRVAQGESLNMFISEKKKMLRPVDLDSQMLMSQEPEADKRKSFDGAGIVITLKR